MDSNEVSDEKRDTDGFLIPSLPMGDQMTTQPTAKKTKGNLPNLKKSLF
jgi:hypothetical protein